MPFIFRPPIRNTQGPRVPTVPNPSTEFDDGGRGNVLMRYVHHHGGHPVAVLLTGSTLTEMQVPTQVQMAAADKVWMGGRDNEVTAAEKNLLEANGYTVLTV